MSDDPIYDMQVAIEQHIKKCEALRTVPLLLSDSGNLLDQVEKATANLPGLSVAVEPVETDLGYSGDGCMFHMTPGIVVTEHPTFNRTKNGTGIRASRAVALLVKHFRPSNNPPCMLKNVKLKQDSANKIEFVIYAIGKGKIS